MTIQHVNVTDPDIHEPKGVSTATLGEVYVANGAGSGFWAVLIAAKTIVVNLLSDLPAPVAGTITLAPDTRYVIGQPIVTTDRFIASHNSSVTANSALGTAITYQGNGAVFTAINSNFYLHDIGVDCPTGQLFDVQDTVVSLIPEIFQLKNVNLVSCVKVGDVTDVNIVEIMGLVCFSANDGIVFSGTRTFSLTLEGVGLVTANAGFTGIDLGSSVQSLVKMKSCSFTGPAGSVSLAGLANNGNISANNIASIVDNVFATDIALSNISVDDYRYSFRGNTGIADTLADGLLSMVGNATATVIPAVNTPTLVAGTWVVERTSQFTGTTAGRFTYNGEKPIVVPIGIVCTVDPVSGTNKSVSVQVAKNGTAIANSGHVVNVSAGDPKMLSCLWQLSLVQNDYLEIFVENRTDGVHITVPTATIRVK
jgi:hypothetical protein